MAALRLALELLGVLAALVLHYLALLVFDLGVYVLVVGLVVTAVTRLGQEYA